MVTVDPRSVDLQPTRSMFRSGSIPFLDALRGLSAIYVVLYHIVLATQFDEYRFARPFLYGHYAVIVFFVLSGFVIHLRQASNPSIVEGERVWHWLRLYAWRRGVRIYFPLVFAVVLTVVLALASSAPGAGRAPRLLVSAARVVIPLGGVLRWNIPLWSVQLEIWFYALYAVLILLYVTRVRISLAQSFVPLVGVGLVSWYLASSLDDSVGGLSQAFRLPYYFPIWLVGALLAEMFVRGRLPSTEWRRGVGGLALIAVALPFTPTKGRVDYPIDYAWALGIALVMSAGLALHHAETPWRRVIGWLAPSAAVSYSLYLVHYPVIRFLMAEVLPTPSSGNRLALAMALCVAAVLASVVTWLLVERPSLALARNLPPRAATPAPQARDAAGARPGPRRHEGSDMRAPRLRPADRDSP